MQLLSPQWPAPANVRAFSTTRLEGVSEGSYASLNLGQHVGDDSALVEQNRRRLMQEADLPAAPIWLDQVHGTRVIRASEALSNALPSSPAQADAMITRSLNTVCCVMTADCLPVFFTNVEGTEVAVAHAGWRGLAAGILEQTLAAFTASADQVMAWAAPAISVAHFEVGAEVREQLGGPDSAWRESVRDGKFYADLYALAADRLDRAGIGWVGCSDHCTFAEADLFFSHRRSAPCGRQASIIYLQDSA